LVIDGVEMELLSLDTNEAIFNTAGVLNHESNDLKFFLAEGFPKGHSENIQDVNLELD
jgi:hypothetical protein